MDLKGEIDLSNNAILTLSCFEECQLHHESYSHILTTTLVATDSSHKPDSDHLQVPVEIFFGRLVCQPDTISRYI